MMSSVTLVSITLAAVIALAVGLLIGFALQKKLHQNNLDRATQTAKALLRPLKKKQRL